MTRFSPITRGSSSTGFNGRRATADAIIINPGGLAHYSVALRDALEDTGRLVVEVHISEPAAREPFRHALITATAAAKVVSGKGLAGYLEALEFVRAQKEVSR